MPLHRLATLPRQAQQHPADPRVRDSVGKLAAKLGKSIAARSQGPRPRFTRRTVGRGAYPHSMNSKFRLRQNCAGMVCPVKAGGPGPSGQCRRKKTKSLSCLFEQRENGSKAEFRSAVDLGQSFEQIVLEPSQRTKNRRLSPATVALGRRTWGLRRGWRSNHRWASLWAWFHFVLEMHLIAAGLGKSTALVTGQTDGLTA